MKKFVVYLNLLAIIALCSSEIGCNGSGEKGKLILSVPDYAIGVVLGSTNASDSTLIANLKQLRAYDNDLQMALGASKDKSMAYFTITKKINPCCPCAPGSRACCQCPMGMTFAAPKTMNASAKRDDGTELAKETVDEVDLFTLDPSDPTTKVTISGNGISQPIEFTRE